MPSDIEGGVAGEGGQEMEVKIGARQIYKAGFSSFRFRVVVESRSNDTGGCTFIAFGVEMVPDVTGVVLLVRRALR